MNSTSLDERQRLQRVSGVRYGMKNESGEYLSVCTKDTTRDLEYAARWIDTEFLDPVLDKHRANDPTWRVLRLLDYRWN